MNNQLFSTKENIFNLLPNNRLGSNDDSKMGFIIDNRRLKYTKSEKDSFANRLRKVGEQMIKDGGFNKDCPIIVAEIDEKLYIIDGQIAAQAAFNLGYEVFYRYTHNKVESIEDALTLAEKYNLNRTNWNAEEKINSYLKRWGGVGIYNTRNDVMAQNNYNISNPQLALMILCGINAEKPSYWDSEAKVQKWVQNFDTSLDFGIKFLAYRQELVTKNTDASYIIYGNSFTKALFYALLLIIEKKGKDSLPFYLSRLKTNLKRLQEQKKILDYTKHIFEIMNYQTDKNRKMFVYRTTSKLTKDCVNIGM